MTNFSLRAYLPSDARAVAEVINAAAMKTVGFPRATVDSVGNLWAYRFVPFSSEKVVVTDQTNGVVGYAYFTSEDHHIAAETGASVHPAHWSKGIGTTLVQWAEERARKSAVKALSGIRTVLQTSLYPAERDAIQLFEAHGYTPVREWVHLVLEMDQPPVVPTLAPHLTIREMDLDNDWEIVGPTMDESYADHWGAIPPGSFEADRKSTRLNSSHGYISYAVFCLKK